MNSAMKKSILSLAVLLVGLLGLLAVLLFPFSSKSERAIKKYVKAIDKADFETLNDYDISVKLADKLGGLFSGSAATGETRADALRQSAFSVSIPKGAELTGVSLHSFSFEYEQPLPEYSLLGMEATGYEYSVVLEIRYTLEEKEYTFLSPESLEVTDSSDGIFID